MTNSTTILSRVDGWRLPVIGVGAVLAVLLLILLLGLPREAVQASSATWTTNLTSGVNSYGNRYGYDTDGNGYGSLSDSTFVYEGHTYTVNFLRWKSRTQILTLGLDACLKPSNFKSLTIGSTEYKKDRNYDPWQDDSHCEDNSADDQDFDFTRVSSNPLPVRTSPYAITITFSGSGSSSSSSSSNSCVISLGTVSGSVNRDRDSWDSSCKSANREGSYAKFYTFTLSSMSKVQIDLTATSAKNPYLYLLKGSGKTGTVMASDDDGGPKNLDSRIAMQLLPGTYTIEATTNRSGVTGDFEVDMSVTPIAAKRVSTDTTNFRRSLSQPKGLAWDGTTLYMVDDGTDALYTVSPSTGRATRVSTRTTRFGLDVSLIKPRDLAWSGSTLYMITSSRLYKLNRTTGVATPIGSFGTDISNATGLAWKRSSTATSTGITGKPEPGRLYMVDTNNDALYIVDTATGSATPTDAFPVDSSVRAFGGSVRTPNGISWVGSDLYMVSNSPGKLHLVNETTGKVTNLGEFGIKSPTDLAWNGSKLFVLDDYTNALYTISGIGKSESPVTTSNLIYKQIGSAARFGVTSKTLSAPRGIAMVNDGLYMVEDNTDFLYTVNRMTGVAAKVGSAGLATTTIQVRDIAWDGSTLYMITRDSLYRINSTSGTSTPIGSLGRGIKDAFGLAWSGENLYMVDRETSALYTVATSTGATSRVSASLFRFGEEITTPSGLMWVGPPPSEVEDDNELPSLYMGDANGKLWKINKDTGRAVSYVGRLGTGDITGLAWDDDTSTLYFVDDTSDALKTVTNFPGFLPNAGDLYFNGSNFADGFVRWDNPSWVHAKYCRTDPLRCATYEHDLKLEWKSSGGWFNVSQSLPNNNAVSRTYDTIFCTAWSDLPARSYDDCPTAGVGRNLEPNTVELGFGTFKATQIEAGRDYYGFWIFKRQRGQGSTTKVRLHGQEGKPGRGYTGNFRCSIVKPELVWCVEGRQQGSLLESGVTWSYGTPNYTTYSRP